MSERESLFQFLPTDQMRFRTLRSGTSATIQGALYVVLGVRL